MLLISSLLPLLLQIQRAIHRRKAAFETKSEEIESYLADIEEREKQWLENDESEKVDESKSPHSQFPVPIASNPISNKNNETQRDAQKFPNG